MQSRVFTLLLVDDDPLIHQSMRLILPSHWRPVSATTFDEVPWSRTFDLAFVDMHIKGERSRGLEILKKISSEHPTTELIAMSGDLRRELMEDTLRAGAQRFLAKPLLKDEVLLTIQKIEALLDLRANMGHRKQTRWIGQSNSSQKVQKAIAELRGESGPVLIEGESGCGKEVVALCLHEQEGPGRPFVAINMAALPENLFESELFGHVKGAFTGAERDRPGLCEAAGGGDLFLDEIEALPMALQPKLLRFLESGEIRRVGAREPSRVHCRVICASNRSLEEMVKNGLFREDLYFRLSGKRVLLPPLRERKSDIQPLAEHFLQQESPKRHKYLAEDGLAALANYDWPGNVRELKRVCEQLCLTSPLPMIRREDISALLNGFSRKEISNPSSLDISKGLPALLEEFEKNVIKVALSSSKDIDEAVRRLQISRSGLYKKIKDYHLEFPE